MKIKFRGVVEMKVRLREVAREFPARLGAALRQETEIEATECKRRTPVDLGTLRASIHVEGPTFRMRQVSCQIVAGGSGAPYAIYVHEDLEAHHDNGEAKFIERPLKESAPHMAERIARRLKL